MKLIFAVLCVTERWVLHVVIKQQFFYILLPIGPGVFSGKFNLTILQLEIIIWNNILYSDVDNYCDCTNWDLNVTLSCALWSLSSSQSYLLEPVHHFSWKQYLQQQSGSSISRPDNPAAEPSTFCCWSSCQSCVAAVTHTTTKSAHELDSALQTMITVKLPVHYNSEEVELF